MNLRNVAFAGLASAFLVFTEGALAQAPDSLSRPAADSLAIADSARSTFLPFLGSFLNRDSTDLSVSRFIWTDAINIEELLNYRPGIFVRTLGSAGQPDLVSVGGIDWRGLAVLVDGRPMNDPVTGVENLYDLPLDLVEQIELATGAESFLFSGNASAAAMNIVSRQFNTGKPITKVRFMQGPTEHLLTDALFTQNITRHLNLTLGVQRQVTDGRFFNSAFDSWGVRSRLRYNPSEKLNLTLSDLYRRSVTGFNNGVLIDTMRARGVDPFNEAEALVSSRTASQTSTRRDVTLNAIASLFPDSTWTTRAAVYYSTAKRIYSDTLSSGPFEDFSWNFSGTTLRQTMRIEPATLEFGGQLEYREASFDQPRLKAKKKYAGWFGNISFHVLDLLEPAGFARGETYADGKAFSYGASITVRPLAALEVRLARSSFARFPSLQELAWGLYRTSAPGSIDLLERHTLIEAGASFTLEDLFKVSANASNRTTTNALLFVPASAASLTPLVIEVSPELSILQFSGEAELKLWVFDMSGSVTYTEAKKQGIPSLLSPKLMLTGEISYRNDLLDGALKTRVGARSRYIGRHDGVRFYPAQMVYAANMGRPLKDFSTLDLFGVFKIGDAYIDLTWGNILDKNYITVYPYPELGRHVRISVNWVFLD